MEAKNYMDNFEVLKHGHTRVAYEHDEGQSSDISGWQNLKQTQLSHAVRKTE